MSSFTHLKRCLDIGEREIAAGVHTREACKDFYAHVANIARPKEGAPKILLVFGRMATTACGWVEGDLRIDVMGDGDVSVVELMSDIGPGVRERILPAFGLNVPYDEFTGAMDRVPAIAAPLIVFARTIRRVVFVAPEALRRTSSPPPMTGIESSSLFPPSSIK